VALLAAPGEPAIGDPGAAPAPADARGGHVVHLPALRQIARSAASHLLEAILVPLGLFYSVLWALGLRWALVAALAWSYAAVARRLVSGQPVPGLLLLGSVLFTVRTVIALVTGSAFVYFLQPTLGTFMVAGLFLCSLRWGRPLAERLAHDFCPLPETLVANGTVRRFFGHISLLWALVYAVNGATTLALLLSSSLGAFLVLKTATSTILTVAAIGLSFLWFRRSLRNEGVTLRWAKAP
jgi:hypothetical protein